MILYKVIVMTHDNVYVPYPGRPPRATKEELRHNLLTLLVDTSGRRTSTSVHALVDAYRSAGGQGNLFTMYVKSKQERLERHAQSQGRPAIPFDIRGIGKDHFLIEMVCAHDKEYMLPLSRHISANFENGLPQIQVFCEMLCKCNAHSQQSWLMPAAVATLVDAVMNDLHQLSQIEKTHGQKRSFDQTRLTHMKRIATNLATLSVQEGGPLGQSSARVLVMCMKTDLNAAIQEVEKNVIKGELENLQELDDLGDLADEIRILSDKYGKDTFMEACGLDTSQNLGGLLKLLEGYESIIPAGGGQRVDTKYDSVSDSAKDYLNNINSPLLVVIEQVEGNESSQAQQLSRPHHGR